ncbi:MAG TPA: NADPH-dependent FMN reductase [Holophaga sp.]|nr:NADPH-dependent FMN reductase [Holophaga sp.]
MKITVMGGSLRKESLNLRLLQHLARTISANGPHVRTVTGDELRLPLLDPDHGAPPEAVSLHALVSDAQGVVIVSPEYNAGIPPHLKNAVDWVSTMTPNPFRGMPVLLASASPGAFGGARCQMQWRATLANLGAFVLPLGITIPAADRSLAPDGTPQEPRSATEIQKAVLAFLEFASRNAPRP